MSSSSSRSATSKPRVVACPKCSAPVPWEPASRFRPFCSERCKMSDLGAWATESYRIPIAEENDQPDMNEAGEHPPRDAPHE
ncbi:MAG TPA: DNA gyrase inhibitor YacG [Burkholderiales bacterium]|nr:DNA gyrase inhibitor YacG [Burkholderiales bacterium]